MEGGVLWAVEGLCRGWEEVCPEVCVCVCVCARVCRVDDDRKWSGLEGCGRMWQGWVDSVKLVMSHDFLTQSSQVTSHAAPVDSVKSLCRAVTVTE